MDPPAGLDWNVLDWHHTGIHRCFSGQEQRTPSVSNLLCYADHYPGRNLFLDCAVQWIEKSEIDGKSSFGFWIIPARNSAIGDNRIKIRFSRPTAFGKTIWFIPKQKKTDLIVQTLQEAVAKAKSRQTIQTGTDQAKPV